MRNSKLWSVLNGLSLVTIGPVIFGMFSLGFFVAPVIFHDLSQRVIASELMAQIFTRFYSVSLYLIMGAIFVELLKFLFFSKSLNLRVWLVQVGFIILTAYFTGYSSMVIAPRINELRLTETKPTLWLNTEFTDLHKKSEQFGKALFLTGLIPLLIMYFPNRRKLEDSNN